MHKQSVIFDMDGTLFDTETIFQEEWNRLARERGLALPPPISNMPYAAPAARP